MIPVLFKEDEQVFSHNGIGALYESLSCDVVEEENGSFTMELEYPVDGEWFSEIKDFRIIQAKPNDIDDPHNFRIYEIVKSIDELSVYVRASTITNDLGNNLITKYVANRQTAQLAMNGIKNNLVEPTNFDLISDIQTVSTSEWERINPLNAIVGTEGSLVDNWGGEIKRTNNAIHLFSRRGKDKVAVIRPGKNILGLDMTVSTAGLVTKVLPTFSYRPVEIPKYQMVTLSNGKKEKRRVTNTGSTNIEDDITVLGDVVESKHVNNYPLPYWQSVDYGDDEELRESVDKFINDRLKKAEESSTVINNSNFKKELKNYVKTQLDKRAKQYFTHRNPGVDIPTVRIKVNMLQLADSPEWEEFKDLERIGLTDTLEVWVEKYDIDVEVRVTTLTYDSIGEQVVSFDAGSDKPPRQSVQEKKYADLTKSLNDYKTTVQNGVNNIMRNTADGLNRKFEGYTEPPSELSSEGDIWFKEIGDGKVEIWIHDGVYWQPLMSEDFGKKLEADIENTQAELEEAKKQSKSDADQAYENAVTEADRLAAIRDNNITIEAGQITAGIIDAARLDAVSIVTKGLSADVVKANHIQADDALFDMLFTSTLATDRLSAQTAWIKNANIADASINGAKIADATIGNAKIASLDVSKISGNRTEFVQSAWNSVARTVEISAEGLVTTLSGSNTNNGSIKLTPLGLTLNDSSNNILFNLRRYKSATDFSISYGSHLSSNKLMFSRVDKSSSANITNTMLEIDPKTNEIVFGNSTTVDIKGYISASNTGGFFPTMRPRTMRYNNDSFFGFGSKDNQYGIYLGPTGIITYYNGVVRKIT